MYLNNSTKRCRYMPAFSHWTIRETTASTLSYAFDIESYIKVCTEETTQETLNAIVSSVQLQDQGESTWLTALTSDPSILSYHINHISSKPSQIPHVDILQAQQQDKAIGRVFYYLKLGRRPTKQEKASESATTKQLLHEWEELSLDSNGLIRRKSGPYNQLVLPKKYHRLVKWDTLELIVSRT